MGVGATLACWQPAGSTECCSEETAGCVLGCQWLWVTLLSSQAKDFNSWQQLLLRREEHCRQDRWQTSGTPLALGHRDPCLAVTGTLQPQEVFCCCSLPPDCQTGVPAPLCPAGGIAAGTPVARNSCPSCFFLARKRSGSVSCKGYPPGCPWWCSPSQVVAHSATGQLWWAVFHSVLTECAPEQSLLLPSHTRPPSAWLSPCRAVSSLQRQGPAGDWRRELCHAPHKPQE